MKIRPINVERTRRHMLRSTPDVLVVPTPTNMDEEDAMRLKFQNWARNWAALHPGFNPPTVTVFREWRTTRFTITKG